MLFVMVFHNLAYTLKVNQFSKRHRYTLRSLLGSLRNPSEVYYQVVINFSWLFVVASLLYNSHEFLLALHKTSLKFEQVFYDFPGKFIWLMSSLILHFLATNLLFGWGKWCNMWLLNYFCDRIWSIVIY